VIVLDTHVLLWAAADDRKLGRKTRQMIDRLWSSGTVTIPSIVFWEVGLLQIAGRQPLPMSVREWRDGLVSAGIKELPLDGEVALRAAELTGLHADPADRFIAATALVHDATLITADERLLAWKHSLDRHDARL